MTCPRETLGGRDPRIHVDSDLPELDTWEPWEREAVVEAAVDALTDSAGTEDSDAEEA